MKPLTKEWVEKAEGDFETAKREMRARRLPNYDSACFHAQQCGEKYSKARLQEAHLAFPYTHDLKLLLSLAVTIEPLWAILAQSAKVLSEFAVKSRYPGANATRDQAKDAVKRCGDFRTFSAKASG